MVQYCVLLYEDKRMACTLISLHTQKTVQKFTVAHELFYPFALHLLATWANIFRGQLVKDWDRTVFSVLA